MPLDGVGPKRLSANDAQIRAQMHIYETLLDIGSASLADPISIAVHRLVDGVKQIMPPPVHRRQSRLVGPGSIPILLTNLRL